MSRGAADSTPWRRKSVDEHISASPFSSALETPHAMKSARKRDDAGTEATAKKQKTVETSDEAAGQVATALRKIRCYVGLPAKFNKAARLVLNLCHEGHITAAYSQQFFEVLALALVDKDVCLAPEYRKGYSKLISKAVEMASLFSTLQRKQLEVYQIWTICRSEMQTDDSFLFGKNMAKLRELVLQLPVCAEAEGETLGKWKEKMVTLREYYETHRRELESSEDDAAVELVWSEQESLVARKNAIIDWLEASKSMYRHQWACTAIDISIKVLNDNKDKFCQEQRVRIEELLRFSKDQKLRRRQGPSVKEKKRDTTAFDEARSEWAKEKVSNRGMVGSTGDHKTEAWLG